MTPPHSSSFHVANTQKHFKWNRAIPPILTVSSGSTITFDLHDGGDNQFSATSTSADVETFDFNRGDPAFGPVYIEGAEAGDVLKVEFLELQPAEYGWTCIFPSSVGFGLLFDEFPVGVLKVWDLSNSSSTDNEKEKKKYTVFKPGIHIPIRPFLGVVGVAREEEGEFSTIPPYETGGNIDTKYITAGSTLYLPVKVPGALFSCGDGHAAQGDGEVCGSAIETPMKASVRLTVEKGMPWVKSPHYLTNPPSSVVDPVQSRGEYAALGIDPDLREASRKALRSLLDWLVATKDLTREEAYILASVGADLKITEAVDMPNYAVACSIPLSIFVGEQYQ